MAPRTLWYTRCPVPTASGIALRLGVLHDEFAADGVEVRSLASSPDPAVRQSHFTHTQPGFFRQGGNIPPLVARSRGTDVRLVGFSWPRTSHPVLAAPDSRIREPADLAGRRLSVPRRVDDGIDFWRPTVLRGWEQALALAGLTFDDVELVDVPVARRFIDAATGSVESGASLWGAIGQLGFQREEAAALARGAVDALFSEAGFSVILRGLLGLRVVVDLEGLPEQSQRVNNGIPLALTVSGALLDERPDLVARWHARVADAATWAADHELEAKRIIAREAALPEELVDAAFGPRSHDDLAIGLGPEGLEALRAQHDRLLAQRVLDAPVDLDAYVARIRVPA
jgi:ABC-type nitrate/sulfonate/bicarbonate transport system substrate-binding protein